MASKQVPVASKFVPVASERVPVASQQAAIGSNVTLWQACEWYVVRTSNSPSIASK